MRSGRSIALRVFARLAPIVLVAAPSRSAVAGDALRERTPVVHLDASCLTVIDRATTSVVHLDYTFPFEDTCGGVHPPPTHQFFALCRPPAPGEALPLWITRGDIAYAAALGMALPTYGADEVLEESPAWAGCWSRITADDDRRPLTCEAALAGVDWDVRAAPTGVQVIAAYTFHPPIGRWSPRWGIFSIVDGDPAAAPPVAAIANRAAFVYADEVMTLRACAAAMPGSTLRFEFAIDGAAPLTWQAATAALEVAGDEVVAPWDPPAAVEGQNVRLRATITDPLGRASTLEAPELQAMLAVPLPAGGPADPPPPPADTCRDDEAPAQVPCPPSASASDSSSSDGATTDEPAITDAGACACVGAPTPRSLPWIVLVPLVARRRRAIATCR